MRAPLPCVVGKQLDDGAWEIGLSRGLVAIVDDADLASVVAAGKWSAHPGRRDTFYARKKFRVAGRPQHVKLHTFLTGWPLVDHVNGDGLDNRRANLRPATRAGNCRNIQRPVTNTSGYKGVSWHKGQQKWNATISVGRQIHIGSFADPIDAARAYDAAARELHGEFARPNFVSPDSFERVA